MIDWLRVLAARIKARYGGRKMDGELKDEFDSHVALLTERNIRRGMSESEAASAARRQFGNLTLLQEESREMRKMRFVETFVQDARYGARILRRSHGFALVAVFTLALGIGANTAIFSVINAVLLRPLPFEKPEELFALYRTTSKNESSGPISPIHFLELKEQNHSLTGAAAISVKGWPANLTGAGEPERLQGYQVTGNLFETLGARAALGRTFLPDEDQPGNHRVVVLSHEFWERRFGRDAALIGRGIYLNGGVYTVIGVMPANFRIYSKTDLWTPLAFSPSDKKDGANSLWLVGRLRSGITHEQARAELDGIYRRQMSNPNVDAHLGLRALQESLTRDVRRTLWVLFAAVGFVLLIACVNIANLSLARASVRRREFAIRTALGAGRRRIVRQLLIESGLLAALGGASGLLLAAWGVRFLAGGLPEGLRQTNYGVETLGLDRGALGFTLGLTCLTTILFGLLPALHASKENPGEALTAGGRSEPGGGGHSRLHSSLVATEVALAVVLLIGAGLAIKSFWRLSHVDPGFSPGGVLTARIDPTYKEFQEVVGFYQRLMERVSAIPGVRRAGIINSLDSSWGFIIDGHPPLETEKRPGASTNQVSGDYFLASGIPLRAGRLFDDRDVKGATPVALIDETLARRYFPNENPIGKHVTFLNASREIVGVVGATKFYNLRQESSPYIYLPYQQENWWSMKLVVRAQGGDPMALAPSIRRELAAINKDLPIHSFKLLEDSVESLRADQRFSTSLLGAFAALAALLAAIGIHGVLAYAVSRRSHEIGVRLALGATRGDIFRLIAGQGMCSAGVGLAMGLLGAFLMTRWMEALLYEVRPRDPATYALIAGLLALIAFLACFLPARRAAKTDPMIALRSE